MPALSLVEVQRVQRWRPERGQLCGLGGRAGGLGPAQRSGAEPADQIHRPCQGEGRGFESRRPLQPILAVSGVFTDAACVECPRPRRVRTALPRPHLHHRQHLRPRHARCRPRRRQPPPPLTSAVAAVGPRFPWKGSACSPGRRSVAATTSPDRVFALVAHRSACALACRSWRRRLRTDWTPSSSSGSLVGLRRRASRRQHW